MISGVVPFAGKAVKNRSKMWAMPQILKGQNRLYWLFVKHD